MLASKMQVGKRYRLLPDNGTKSELHNAIVERLVGQAGYLPLVRVVKIGGRRRGRTGGSIVHAGDTVCMLLQHEVEDLEKEAS